MFIPLILCLPLDKSLLGACSPYLRERQIKRFQLLKRTVPNEICWIYGIFIQNLQSAFSPLATDTWQADGTGTRQIQIQIQIQMHLTGRRNWHQRKVPLSPIVSKSHLSRLSSALVWRTTHSHKMKSFPQAVFTVVQSNFWQLKSEVWTFIPITLTESCHLCG